MFKFFGESLRFLCIMHDYGFDFSIVASSSSKSHYVCFCAQSASMEIFVHRMNVRNWITIQSFGLGSNIQCLFMNLNNLCAFLGKEMMVNQVIRLKNEFSYF